MRVRCVSRDLPEQILNPRLRSLQGRWPVRVGVEYRVLAARREAELWFLIVEHHEREAPVTAPLVLFEITEPSVSSTWKVCLAGERELAFQPEEFQDPYFSDDVQERRGDALERYRAMKARLDE